MTTTHPCRSSGCSIYYIAFHQRKNTVELQTRCRCEKLCIWGINTDSITLLQEMELKWEGYLKWWADDFSKAISKGTDPSNPKGFLTVFIDGNETCRHSLEHIDGAFNWRFSSGTGERFVGWSTHQIDVFEGSSRRLYFQNHIDFDPNGRFDQVLFSPDTKFLFYCFIHYLNAPPNVCVTSLVNLDNGTQVWSKSIGWIPHVEFFADGDRILIGTNTSIYIMSSFDGCIKHSYFLNLCHMSISPTSDRIALMFRKGTEVLDSTTLNRIHHHTTRNPNHCTDQRPLTIFPNTIHFTVRI
jgi:hypothetical protein